MTSRMRACGIFGLNDLVAIAVNHLPLLVHDVVVLQHPLPAEVVAFLHPLLGHLDGAGQQRAFEFLAFLSLSCSINFVIRSDAPYWRIRSSSKLT